MNETLPAKVLDEAPRPAGAYARFARRFQATLVDALVLFTVFFLLVLLATEISAPAVARAVIGLAFLFVLLYEPVLVSVRGATVGHRLLNLRVVADETGGNLAFGRSLLRGLLKALLGLPSFVFMGLTRRRQALHDLVSRSTVQVHDLSRALPHHYAAERPAEFEPAGVSRTRRALVIVSYSAVAYIAAASLAMMLVSDPCYIADLCGTRDDLVFALSGFAWLAATAWVAVHGWKGQLFGCRAKRMAYLQSEMDSPPPMR